MKITSILSTSVTVMLLATSGPALAGVDMVPGYGNCTAATNPGQGANVDRIVDWDVVRESCDGEEDRLTTAEANSKKHNNNSHIGEGLLRAAHVKKR